MVDDGRKRLGWTGARQEDTSWDRHSIISHSANINFMSTPVFRFYHNILFYNVGLCTLQTSQGPFSLPQFRNVLRLCRDHAVQEQIVCVQINTLSSRRFPDRMNKCQPCLHPTIFCACTHCWLQLVLFSLQAGAFIFSCSLCIECVASLYQNRCMSASWFGTYARCLRKHKIIQQQTAGAFLYCSRPQRYPTTRATDLASCSSIYVCEHKNHQAK